MRSMFAVRPFSWTGMMAFVRSLADQPRTPGDFTDTDESQRTRQIKIIGHYAVIYWVDEPVRTVMVVGVRPADQ